MPKMSRLLVVLSLPLLALAGCSHCHPRPQAAPCPGPGAVIVPGPGPAPGGPPGTQVPQGPAPFAEPPPPGPVQSKSPDFSQDLTWKPGGTGPSVRLYPPEVSESTDDSKKTPIKPPEVFENDKPAPKVDFGKPEVPVVDKPKVEAYKPNPFPVGIPQFGQVSDNYASGLRPSLDDGLDWLRDNGYKAVIFIRAPGETDTADKKQVERRGMKFYSLEVSPQALTRKLVDDFSAVVGDPANQPVFAYDTDGSRVGALWYLHFRIAQKASDETARKQARVLGLHEDRAGASREMWEAVQRVLD
jgi:protein tyrosine phosphatase (PTP) superfamily phosphohydrolase (DUF442 family)